jgi:hypothetical protein
VLIVTGGGGAYRYWGWFCCRSCCIANVIVIIISAAVTVPTALLQDGGEAESVHPLHHKLSSVCRKVVRSHVSVLCLEGELAVHTVLRRAGRDLVRRQQDRPQQLLLFGTWRTDTLIYGF